MKVIKGEWSVDRLWRMFKNNTISFELVIQRKDNIWDLKRKSALIHSILMGYPIPAVFATRNERGTYLFLDGKQRLTTIFSYLNDEFSLVGVSSVDGEEVADRKFSELSEQMQHRITHYAVDVNRVEDISQQEMEELFYRLNNGVPLRRIETTRAILGGRVLKFVENIASMDFFAEKVNLSKASRQRYVDQELILQILALVHNRDTGFSGEEIQSFVAELRNVEIRDELRAKMQNACFYLNEAFPRKEKFLKKVHVPMLFKLVLDAQERNALVPPKEFGEWARHFFNHLPEEYSAACTAGSARKEKVQRRLALMSEAFERYLAARSRGEWTLPGGNREGEGGRMEDEAV
ncbi:MAG: DUF262 domain-containing protein [Alicyclobacillus sp.]|nr:DUF262 domain-containing protein [Alicyclobacillus sp.]